MVSKWNTFYSEKDLMFVSYIKQQIKKYLSIFNFKYMVLFAYENVDINSLMCILSLDLITFNFEMKF